MSDRDLVAEHETSKLARFHAVRPDGFCEDCQEIVRERRAEAA